MAGLSDNAPCGYISFNSRGDITYCNGTGAELLGYSPAELDDQPVEKILTVAGKIFFQTHLFPMVSLHGYANEIFLSFFTKDGKTLPVVTNTKQAAIGDVPAFHCVFIPVPNRRRYEDELLAAKKAAEEKLNKNTELVRLKIENELQARELDKYIHMQRRMNDDLRQLSYIINHDMQEYIRKVIILTEKIVQEGDLNLLKKISASAYRLKAINSTQDLYVKTLSSGNEYFSNLDLNKIVEEGLNSALMETDFRNIKLSADPLPKIFGSYAQLSQLFYQLFSNAIKFRRGDSLAVTIEHVMFDANVYRATSNKYTFTEFLKLKFSDDGTGFDDKYNAYVFDLLKKLDAGETAGLGFGLSICKKIVDNHLGEISISSRESVGTAVTIILPVNEV